MPRDAGIRDVLANLATANDNDSVEISALVSLAESYLQAGTEWPEIRHCGKSYECHKCPYNSECELFIINETNDLCRLVHLRIVAEKDREIERLRKIVDGITVETIEKVLLCEKDCLADLSYESDIREIAKAIVKELKGGKE